MADAVRSPAVRAASVQDVLAYLDKYELGATERVRGEIPDDVLATIDTSPRLGWIDVEDDVWVPTAMWSVLGEEDAHDMMLGFLQSHFDSLLLKPLVRTTRKVFGLTPMNVLRMVPSGWKLAYRDICEVEVESVGSASGQLVLRDVTPVVIGSRAYLMSFVAILTGAVSLTGYETSVTLSSVDDEARSARFDVSWNAQR